MATPTYGVLDMEWIAMELRHRRSSMPPDLVREIVAPHVLRLCRVRGTQVIDMPRLVIGDDEAFIALRSAQPLLRLATMLGDLNVFGTPSPLSGFGLLDEATRALEHAQEHGTPTAIIFVNRDLDAVECLVAPGVRAALERAAAAIEGIIADLDRTSS